MRNEKTTQYCSRFLVFVFAIASLSACRFPGTGLDGLEDESDSTTAPEFAFIANTNSAVIGSDFSVAPLVLKARAGEIASCEVEPGTTSLPPGLSLNPTTCAISGRPASVLEETTFSLLVRNTAGKSSKASLKIRVMPGYPVLAYATGTVTGTVGVPFSHSPTELNTNCGSIIFCGVIGGTAELPNGLTIHPSTCVISGVPVAAQIASTYQIETTNSTGLSQPATIYVAVAVGRPELSYASSTGTTGTVGGAMSVSPSILNANGAAVSACAVKSGTTVLPGSLSVHPTTCTISGTPSEVLASTTYTLVATNSGGVSDDAMVSLSVGAAVPALSYASSAGKLGTVGSAMSVVPSTLSANGASITACGIKGGTTALPGYLTVSSTTCEISGTPTATLSSTIYTLVASNAAGDSANANVEISVQMPMGPAFTWMAGSDQLAVAAVQGSKGVPAPGNIPGSRWGATTFTDSAGNFWLYGGSVKFDEVSYGTVADFWKFDGANWTWLGGGSTWAMEWPSYGTKGAPSPSNKPGMRNGAASWVDATDNLWLFGSSDRNDLWRYDGTNWTWISGTDLMHQTGVYGTQGVGDIANVPGSRKEGVSWLGSQGNLWLYGGFGYGEAGSAGPLNDVWMFDGTHWIWVHGDKTRNSLPNYGTIGVAAETNSPGGRSQAAHCTDSSGKPWLFGGIVATGPSSTGRKNDLWKFDGTSWIWISGNGTSSFGTLGVTSPANLPPSRAAARCWIDSTNQFWLYGGIAGSQFRNDLWKFDGTNWTWMAGSSAVDAVPSYGTLGSESTSNDPGARSSFALWKHPSGAIWFYGGQKTSVGTDYFADLWRLIIH